MKTEDLTVTLRLNDEVTPVVRRIRRELWWTLYGWPIVTGLALVVGVLVGMALR